jgi:hypothetical protein
VDVTNNEAAIAAAERGPGLVHMMWIAVTGSMGQVATGGAEFNAVARVVRNEPPDRGHRDGAL